MFYLHKLALSSHVRNLVCIFPYDFYCVKICTYIRMCTYTLTMGMHYTHAFLTAQNMCWKSLQVNCYNSYLFLRHHNVLWWGGAVVCYLFVDGHIFFVKSFRVTFWIDNTAISIFLYMLLQQCSKCSLKTPGSQKIPGSH